MMSGVMRTIGPLHFEDLEPRRFEDLVRQLVYDFRPWRALEATGRSGSDDGFDARGFEIVDGGEQAVVDDADNTPSGEVSENASNDRIWLIQCKREGTITPAKLRKYLLELPSDTVAGLYGIIFVAACNFSKAAHDVFMEWRLEKGVGEGHLWGKANLEDQLYQPKNDGLLFAYFGFSLRIRRRSIKIELRAKLAMKRKSERVLSQYQIVLLRDPADERYPYLLSPEDELVTPRRWKVRRYLGQDYFGLKFELYTQYAYLADDGESWDAVEAFKNGVLRQFEDPWYIDDDTDPTSTIHSPVWFYWNKLHDRNQANLTVYNVVPYENILDIDEKSDGVFNGPTVYIDTAAKFHRREVVENLERFNSVKTPADPVRRIKHFPDVFPEPDKTSNE